MKARHYPIATLLGLVLFTVLPLGLLMLPHWTDQSEVSTLVDADADPSQADHTFTKANDSSQDNTKTFASSAQHLPPRDNYPQQANDDLKPVTVASAPNARIPLPDVSLAIRAAEAAQTPIEPRGKDEIDNRPGSESGEPGFNYMPVVTDIFDAAGTIDSTSSGAGTGAAATDDTVKSTADRLDQVGVPIPPSEDSKSRTTLPDYIRKQKLEQDEASFQLALADVLKSADSKSSNESGQLIRNHTNAAANNAVASTKSGTAKPKTSADRKKSTSSRSRRGKTNRNSQKAAEEKKPAAPPAPQQQKDPYLVPVRLHSPREGRRVRRVEDAVGTTGTRGFPIALVRSDLPDSDWWVQQMVGIRGNAFSARVNFGNQTSIAGSKYKLVFVFLETMDEVRRFRIAKRFKELPDGVLHSQEFSFVRK